MLWLISSHTLLSRFDIFSKSSSASNSIANFKSNFFGEKLKAPPGRCLLPVLGLRTRSQLRAEPAACPGPDWPVQPARARRDLFLLAGLL